MNPIIKWAGGKEKELAYIKENVPNKIERYIEPFVGGGAVFFNINVKKSIINDKSEELINLYKCIKNQDKEFFEKLKKINANWILLEKVVESNQKELIKIYKEYCLELNLNKNLKMIKMQFNDKIYAFVIKHSNEFNGILSSEFNMEIENFINEIVKNLISKMNRMYKIEKQRGIMCEKDILDNIECAFKSAFYMHFRHLYNEHITPKKGDYEDFTWVKPRDITSYLTSHETDNYFYNPEKKEHYIIELKAGGDLDNKKSKAEKIELLKEYFLLKNKIIDNVEKIKLLFATAYNKFGEGNEWKQSQVKQYFDENELLIGKDYWNFVCNDENGFNIVFEQYKKSSKYIKEAIQNIKTLYFE